MRFLVLFLALSLCFGSGCGGGGSSETSQSSKKKGKRKKKKKKTDPKAKKSGIEELREISPDVARRVDALLLELGSGDEERQLKAKEELVKIGHPTVGPMVDLLRHQSWEMRVWGAEVLAEVPSPFSVEGLVRALKDKRAEVRSAAAYAFLNNPNPRAVDPLITLLQDPDAGVRANAAESLGKTQNHRGLDPLLKAAKDKDARVRRCALYGILHLEGPNALEYLKPSLDDESEDVRSTAARVIGKMKTPEGLAFLEKLLLGEVKKDVDPGSVALAMAESGDAALGTLIKVLDRGETDARIAAAKALAELKDESTVGPLCKAFKEGISEAGPALKAIGMPAVRPLIGLLSEDDEALKLKASRYLQEITGQDFGTDAAKWSEWYEFR
jgi:HEAT repeat protein